ncbi:MAG: bifunctional DNA primase/polymerase [Verrucomicrobiota bacterium]
MTRANEMARAAMDYARSGWLVFPLRPKGKAPLTKHGFKDATNNREEVRSFWNRWPTANIGLAIPPGFIILDLDSQEAIQKIQAQDLPLPTTVSSKTARGAHLWYSVQGPVRQRSFPGVDIKAHGGYVVVPPSIHPSGASYRWTVPLEKAAISDCPEWLLHRITSPVQEARRTRCTNNWLVIVRSKVPKGQRNVQLAKFSGLLFRELHRAELAAELLYCWAQVRMDPPLPDDEIRRTLDSIAGKELRRRQVEGSR